jgi:predicted nucleic acid-binding protein
MSSKRLVQLEFDPSTQLSADLLLIDDARAKKVPYHNNLEVIGSLCVLFSAKKLIASIKPSVTLLRCSDFFVSDQLLDQILIKAGESQVLKSVESCQS